MNDLMGALRLQPGERIGIGWRNGAPGLKTAVIPAHQLAQAPIALEDRDAWFAPNPTCAEGAGRRGGAGDVTRLAVLPIDLDAKPGGCGDMVTCGAIIADLTEILGTPPAVNIHSGHGMQPLWTIRVDDPAAIVNTPDDTRRLTSLVKQWGALVTRTAARHEANVDGVFNLDRLHRLPGTHNRKQPDDPKPVIVHENPDHQPLTIRQLTGILNREGIPAPRVSTETRAPIGEWMFGETTDYTRRMIDGWEGDHPTKGRHQWLLSQAVRLACAHRLARISEPDHTRAVETLTRRFRWLLAHTNPKRDESPGEIRDALTHGVKVAETKTDTGCDAELGSIAAISAWEGSLTSTERDTERDIPGPEIGPIDDGIFDARPILADIRDVARARMVAPGALLGVTLVRAACEISPCVQLPPIIGGNGTLNLFAILVGHSSAGKSATLAASNTLHAWDTPPLPVGTGEGIAAAYVSRKDGKPHQHAARALVTVDEIETIAKLNARQGATLLPVLRTAWSAGTLGNQNADPARRLIVHPHTYRLGVIALGQPTKCAGLITDGAAGTPQRFLWFPTNDPACPDECPPLPDLRPLRFPTGAVSSRMVPRVLDVCQVAIKAIEDEQRAKTRGKPDDGNGHILYTRLRVAAILALCDGRWVVSDEDWELAGTIVNISNATRNWVELEIAADLSRQSQARASAKGRESATIAQVVESAVEARCAERIIRHVARHAGEDGEDGCCRRCVSRALSKEQRGHLDPVVQGLINAGELIETVAEVSTGQRGNRLATARWRLPEVSS